MNAMQGKATGTFLSTNSIKMVRANGDFDSIKYGTLRIPEGTPLLFDAATWEPLIVETRFLKHVRETSRSMRPHGAITYAAKLQIFLETLRAYKISSYSEITLDHIIAFRNGLCEGRANSTVNQVIAVVRSFFEWLYVTRRLPNNEIFATSNRIKLDEPEIPIRAIPERELRLVLEQLTGVYRLMCRLALCTGLRAFEVTGLRLSDLPDVSTTKDLWVNLTVVRKGRRSPSLVQCPRRMIEEIYQWIYMSGRPSRVRCGKRTIAGYIESEHIFISSKGLPLAENRLSKEFTAASRKVGIYRKWLTVHSLRHNFGLIMCKHLLKMNQGGGDTAFEHNALLELRNLMGHRSLESTMRYLTAIRRGHQEVVSTISDLYDSYQS